MGAAALRRELLLAEHLASEPNATEILVERVKPLRFSEVNGAYEQAVAMVNSH